MSAATPTSSSLPDSQSITDAARNAPIFIGGAGRSGATLLRVILDAHSRIACGPELKVIPSIACLWAEFQSKYAPFLAASQVGADHVDRLFGDLIAGLLEPLRAHEGKARSVEKSPGNVYFFTHLHRMFPDAAFVHVLRDGRDVVASLQQMDWKTADGAPVDYTRDPRLAARYWVTAVMTGREFARTTAGRSRYCEVRYEELVERPEACLRALFAYLGETWEPAVLSFHERRRALPDESSANQVTQPLHAGSVGRWRDDLTPADQDAVKHEAGGLLRDLGYVRDMNW